MKNCIIMAVMLLGFLALYHAFHTPPAIASGHDLRHNCGASIIWNDVACGAYVGGVADGLAAAGDSTICFPKRFASDQALPIVRRYMEQHPDRLILRSPYIVQGAMRSAYPCGTVASRSP